MPELRQWQRTSRGTVEGHVFGKRGFLDGGRMETSAMAHDFGAYFVTATGSFYRYGEEAPRPRRQTRTPTPPEGPASTTPQTHVDAGGRVQARSVAIRIGEKFQASLPECAASAPVAERGDVLQLLDDFSPLRSPPGGLSLGRLILSTARTGEGTRRRSVWSPIGSLGRPSRVLRELEQDEMPTPALDGARGPQTRESSGLFMGQPCDSVVDSGDTVVDSGAPEPEDQMTPPSQILVRHPEPGLILAPAPAPPAPAPAPLRRSSREKREPDATPVLTVGSRVRRPGHTTGSRIPKWFAGSVTAKHADGRVRVVYDDGDVDEAVAVDKLVVESDGAASPVSLSPAASPGASSVAVSESASPTALPSGRNKRKRSPSPQGPASYGAEFYEVDTLLDKRSTGGAVEYLVRWKGTRWCGHDSWEPEQNITTAPIDEYEQAMLQS